MCASQRLEWTYPTFKQATAMSFMVSMLMAMCSRFISTAEYPARFAIRGISVEKAILRPNVYANLFSSMIVFTRLGRHISFANAALSTTSVFAAAIVEAPEFGCVVSRLDTDDVPQDLSTSFCGKIPQVLYVVLL